MIKVNFVGRLTNDVTEVQGKEKTFNIFSVAVRRDNENTDFIDCFAFTDVIGKYAKKGDMLSISGNLVQTSYTNNEGKTVKNWKCTVTDFEFLGGKKTE